MSTKIGVLYHFYPFVCFSLHLAQCPFIALWTLQSYTYKPAAPVILVDPSAAELVSCAEFQVSSDGLHHTGYSRFFCHREGCWL